MKILVECDIKPVFDFECDESASITHCNELIASLVNNDNLYKNGSISAKEWVNFKIGYTYELQDYQAYMREKDWISIPELPNSMIDSFLPTD